MSAPGALADTPHCSRATRAKVSPEGRWGGRVCHHQLPDAELDVSPATRERLARVWLGQAATEARVADSFDSVRGALSRLGADEALVQLAGRAIDDEHRHAALCEELASRYAGRPLPSHAALSHRRPEHPTAASRAVRDGLWVTGQCALNETLATAYLSAARSGAKAPLARAAIRELMEDEIDHARVGWAFLADLSAAAREPLQEWLLPLTICNVREWNKLELPDDESLAPYGVPSREAARVAVRDAIEGVLVPGFAYVGLDPEPIAKWLRSGASLDLAA